MALETVLETIFVLYYPKHSTCFWSTSKFSFQNLLKEVFTKWEIFYKILLKRSQFLTTNLFYFISLSWEAKVYWIKNHWRKWKSWVRKEETWNLEEDSEVLYRKSIFGMQCWTWLSDIIGKILAFFYLFNVIKYYSIHCSKHAISEVERENGQSFLDVI